MITLNKDRKQTKYGHKRREHMTHTTEAWHNSPLPEGVSHAVTVPPGRGGGRALWRPLGTDTDRNTGRGPPERNRQYGGHGGAGSSGGHGGAGSSGGHGRWCSGPWPQSPRPGPYNRNPFYPLQKIKFPGEVSGYQEPSGAKHRHRTALRG